MAAAKPRQTPRLAHALRGKYGFLLGALVALLLSSPTIVEGVIGNLFLHGIASCVLVTGLMAARPGKSALMIGLILAAADLVIGRMGAYTRSAWMLYVVLILWLGTLLYVTGMILEAILSAPRVTLETLQASICVYLLLGVLWAFIYALLDVVVPGEFQFQRRADFSWANDVTRRTEFLRLFYFSFSIMSGVGGAATGSSGWLSRMLACLEAMTSQIYLAVLIARLVGMHVGQGVEVVKTDEPSDER